MTVRSIVCSRHAVAVLSGLVLGVSSRTADGQAERRTLSGERVAVYNLAGRVRVQSGSGSQVTVDITRGGADARNLKIESGDVRGWNALRIIYPSDRVVYRDRGDSYRTTLTVNADGTFGDARGDRGFFSRDRDRVEIRSSGSGMDAYADLTISVPKGQRVAVHLGVGEAIVTNVDGDVMVDVAAARVEASQTRGRLSLSTGSGSVTVTDAQGTIDLDTGSGGATVSGVRGESLRMDTGSGSIRVTDIDVREFDADVGSGGMRLLGVKSPRITLDAGSGSVELELLADVDDLRIDTGSGGVTVRIPTVLGAEVEIETGSGGIDTEIPVTMTKWQRDYLRGTIGDGRGRIRIEAGSGRVRLVK
jgi:lia operon protein LiaG